MKPKPFFLVKVYPDARNGEYGRIYLPPYLAAKYGITPPGIVEISETEKEDGIVIRKKDIH